MERKLAGSNWLIGLRKQRQGVSVLTETGLGIALRGFEVKDWTPFNEAGPYLSADPAFAQAEQVRQAQMLENQLRAVFGYTQKLDQLCSRVERIASIVEAILQRVTATGTEAHISQTGSHSPIPSDRTRELEWRKSSHGEFLGQWVVVEGDQVIAHGADAAEVVKQARGKGVSVPYLFRVEEPAQDVADIGL